MIFVFYNAGCLYHPHEKSKEAIDCLNETIINVSHLTSKNIGKWTLLHMHDWGQLPHTPSPFAKERGRTRLVKSPL
jgi:hypothetical protein